MYNFLDWKHHLNDNEVFVLLTKCAPRLCNGGRYIGGIRQCLFRHNAEGNHPLACQ